MTMQTSNTPKSATQMVKIINISQLNGRTGPSTTNTTTPAIMATNSLGRPIIMINKQHHQPVTNPISSASSTSSLAISSQSSTSTTTTTTTSPTSTIASSSSNMSAPVSIVAQQQQQQQQPIFMATSANNDRIDIATATAAPYTNTSQEKIEHAQLNTADLINGMISVDQPLAQPQDQQQQSMQQRVSPMESTDATLDLPPPPPSLPQQNFITENLL